MRISVFGMGYVGTVSAACFADFKHAVVGVDVNLDKISRLAEGKSPIVEPGINELLEKAIGDGHLRVTDSVSDAVQSSELSMVCVGTPGQRNGKLDLRFVRGVSEQIGSALADLDHFHTVVMRSTMLPGTIHETVIPAIEKASGKSVGRDFAVAINPEFLREGTAVSDFIHPPFTLIGSDDERATTALRSLYKDIDAEIVVTSIREAEMVKYACNCFHAVKVSFANEIGNICKQAGIDSHVVMDVFCKDEKLNLSRYYLKPGFAFGGSCLPKDLRAINYKARQLDLESPLLAAVMPSNELQVDAAFDRIVSSGVKKISLLGLSFKSNTDDMRESPMVTLAERLLGKGYDLKIFDREVQLARIFGSNKAFIDEEIPHLSRLLKDSFEEVVDHGDLIIVAKKDPFTDTDLANLAGSKKVVDLVRVPSISHLPGYDGICW